MKLGIRSKYFLVFLGVSLLIVFIMLLFTRWSIYRGFTAFIEDRQERRLQQITERLIDYYEYQNGWHEVKSDKRVWLALLFGPEPRHMNHNHQAPDRFRHRRFPFQRLLIAGNNEQWPPDRVLAKINSDAPRLPFEARIMLLDQNQIPIQGRTDQIQNSKLSPIYLQNNLIGYLALIRGPSISEAAQLKFISQQHSGLIWIGLGILILSALISIILSKRLVNPIRSFSIATHELASGNFESRVSIDRTDELGELAHDINQLAKSLQANEQSRRQWVADIAHELRTPLSIMQSELEALQSGIRALDMPAINSLHEDTLRLGRLIDDLYDLSITDLGALSYRKTEVAINDILQESIDDANEAFIHAGITMDTNLQASNGTYLLADAQRLVQLFNNILSNTLRYTDTPGKAKIFTTLVDEQLTIDFVDSSPGVPLSSIPHLFERLYRVEHSRSRDTGGTGLGLAIAHNIVRAHGGTITAMPADMGGLWIKITFSGISKQ